MTLSSRNKLSIAELVLYTPGELFSIFLCIRHGFGPNKGWLFLLIFSLIRLAGASLELATIGFPTSIPLQTSAALLSSVGLSPLLFTTLGLLFRICKSINKEYHTIIQTIHIRLLRVPVIVALVLVIIGSDASASDLINHGTYPIQLMTKFGVIILIVVFIVVVLITALFVIRRSHAEPGEKRLINAITASLPFLLIRLIYVVLIFFSHIRIFSIIYGSVIALGCMAIMPEMVVVIIYVGVGATLSRKIKEQGARKDTTWSRGRRKIAGGIERFARFLERPKAFAQRVRGHKIVASKESTVLSDFRGEKFAGDDFSLAHIYSE